MPDTSVPRPERIRPTSLGDLLTARLTVPAVDGGRLPDVTVTGVTLDSRAVRPGDLYAALPGARTHGARFVDAAARAGAVAVLTDADGAATIGQAGLPVLIAEDPRAELGGLAATVYGEPTRRLRVLGVTGTAGKTTVSYLVEAGLRACGSRTGLLGTVVNRFDTGDGEVTLDASRTTPESPDLQALFAVMLERGVDSVAMEVSSHALALDRVAGTHFEVAAFTNLGSDHLDFHPDVEDYFAAKARLFDGRARHEIVNVDDRYGRRLIRPKTITVSTASSAAGDEREGWTVDEVRPSDTGTAFVALGPRGLRLPTGVRLPGTFNVDNALIAIAVGVASGADPLTFAEGVAAAPGVPGRMERVGQFGPVHGVVDYAHKPEAITAVLQALRPVTAGRLLVVIGAGGDRDSGKRASMGAAAAAGADMVVVTDDNPRSEDPTAIRAAVLAGARSVAGDVRLLEVGDRRAAIRTAAGLARPGDTVAVLGKGHEKYQEVDGVRQPFDDRAVLAEALAGMQPGVPAGWADGTTLPGEQGAVNR